MQINLDMRTLDIEYVFKIPVSSAKGYSKIAIKFLYEDEIQSLLNRFYTSN